MSMVTIVMEEEEYKKYLSQKEEIANLGKAIDKEVEARHGYMNDQLIFLTEYSEKLRYELIKLELKQRNYNRWQHFKIALGLIPK